MLEEGKNRFARIAEGTVGCLLTAASMFKFANGENVSGSIYLMIGIYSVYQSFAMRRHFNLLRLMHQIENAISPETPPAIDESDENISESDDENEEASLRNRT